MKCDLTNKSDRGVEQRFFILPSKAADSKSRRQGRAPSSAEKEEDDELTTVKRYQTAIEDLVVLTLVLAIDYLNCFFNLHYSAFRFLKAEPNKQYILLRVIRL